MITPLLLALVQSAALTAGAQARPVAQTVWPTEWMQQRCPEFRGLDTSDIAECRVTEWGEFASFEGDVYFYVHYCVIVIWDDVKNDGSCAEPLRSHLDRTAAAIFSRQGSSIMVRLVTSQYVLPGFGRFEKPSIVLNTFGAMMELPFRVASTADGNGSSYHLWQRTSREWQRLDWDGWQKDLDQKLPPKLRSVNGFWPNLASMTAVGGLWRPEDAHCCPTGGTVVIQLGISDNLFVLKSVEVLLDPPSALR